MRSMLPLLALGCGLVLGGCGGDVDDDLQGTPSTGNASLESSAGVFVARFDPANAVLPFPSDLLFSGTDDGTLNIPLEGTLSAGRSNIPISTVAADGPVIALNALDGFSTVAPFSAAFSAPIDATSITPAAVRVFEVEVDPLNNRAVTGVVGELTFGVDFIASVSSVDASGSTLAVLPLRPLKPKTSYLVALTKAITSTAGTSVAADSIYNLTSITGSLLNGTDSILPEEILPDASAAALEPLRLLVNAQRAALSGAGVDLSQVVLSWSFSTQSVGDVLSVVRSLSTGAASVLANLGPSDGINPALGGLADVHVGTLTLPYYLPVPTAGVPDAPLIGSWEAAGLPPAAFFPNATEKHLTQFNPVPLKRADATVPLLLTVPNGASPSLGNKPADGWPTVIFQHGITRNRSDVLAVADGLAAAGFAVLAIDMPLHGITDATNPLHQAPNLDDPAAVAGERTFGLDLVQQDDEGSIVGTGPDTEPDSSGRHFINLTSLLSSRDNLRQAVADLFSLVDAIPAIDFDGTAGGDLDPANVYFLGHSLGAIVGTAFAALESGVKDVVLAMPGGGVAKLLDGSPAFAPEIEAGLAAQAGLVKGSADYESFLGAAQTVIDAGDPINYAALLGARTEGALVLEVVGDGAGNLPDQVIPNNVGTLGAGFQDAPAGTAPGPLSGTDPLIAQLGATQVGTTTGGDDQIAAVRFSAGHHGSILSPNDVAGNPDPTSAVVTSVMQTLAGNFLASDGALIKVDTTPGDTPESVAAAEAVVEQPGP